MGPGMLTGRIRGPRNGVRCVPAYFNHWLLYRRLTESDYGLSNRVNSNVLAPLLYLEHGPRSCIKYQSGDGYAYDKRYTA